MNVKAIVVLTVLGIVALELVMLAVGLMGPLGDEYPKNLDPDDGFDKVVAMFPTRDWIFMGMLVALWVTDVRLYVPFVVLFYALFFYYTDSWADVPCTGIVGCGAPFTLPYVLALLFGLPMRDNDNMPE